MRVDVRHVTVQQGANTALSIRDLGLVVCTSKLIVPYDKSDVTAGRSRTG